MAGTSDAEDRCPLCPPSGPPLPSAKDPLDLLAAAATNVEPADDDGPDFIWISCSRCAIWFHSVCLLMGNEKPRETVPLQVREEIVVNHAEEGAWTNWVGWIDKW